ncbi:MAG TPA: amino acid ABC transporter substrate-binding protein [Stellaceae bacterium]|nr:amino acid ABC transporter substrate-binding protein [Stellaceae bacterium]
MMVSVTRTARPRSSRLSAFAVLLLTLIGATVGALPARAAVAGPTLNAVRMRGMVACGVSTGVAGFSLADSHGNYTGLDVDICRALSAAIFGTPDKVKFVPLNTQQRFTALQSGAVDLLSRDTTWTLQREASLGILFTAPVYYDGQGFMVSKKLGIKSVKQLSGATICLQPGTSTERDLTDYFRANHMSFKPLVIENFDAVQSAFYSGKCDALTADASGLAASRVTKAPNPDDYVILPETVSKEPLAPAVRQGDDQWFDVVRWTVFALIEGEEKGITSKNIDGKLKSDDPEVQRLLGVTSGMGTALGLDDKWAYNILKSVGNYGEIFERNVGRGSPLKLERGLNELWTAGGLLYAPPLE